MKKLTQKILFCLIGKIGIVSLMAICLALFSSSMKAQQTLLVNYDFASAVAGTPCTATPLTTAAGVTSIFTTGGTNEGTCTTVPGMSTRSNAFAENKDENLAVSLGSSAIDAVNYCQFQLNGVSAFHGYKMYFEANQSGPIDIQYSIDGNNFASFTQLPNPILKWSFQPRLIDLSSVTTIDGQPTVYFRLVGKSDRNPGLRFDLDNFQVQATAATKSRKRVRFF